MVSGIAASGRLGDAAQPRAASRALAFHHRPRPAANPTTCTRIGRHREGRLSCPTHDLVDVAIWPTEVVPARVPLALNRPDELDPSRFHDGSGMIDIVNQDADHRPRTEEAMVLIG